MDSLLEQPRRDMISSGFAGALAALQIWVFFDHVLPKLVLPLRQLFIVAYDFLGAEPPVRRQRDKAKVHMGRFLVHMHHGGDDRFRVLMLLDKAQRLLKEGFDFALFLALEELRAGRHQRLYDAHAVRPRAAARLRDLLFRLGAVLALRRHQMEVEVTAGRVHVGIAGVFLLGALVVGLDVPDLRPLVLGKAENGVLRFHRRSPRFTHTMSQSSTSASSITSL